MSRLDALTLAAAAIVAIVSLAEGGAGAAADAPEPARAASLRPAVDAVPIREVEAPPVQQIARCEPLRVELPELIAVPGVDRPIPAIEDAAGSLAPFYEHLARFLRGNATDHLRIGVYGDSNGTKDYLTGEMRRYWQLRYGDAGHGYIALAKPWEWYIHRDIGHGLNQAFWGSHAVSTNWLGDGYYGHGLIAGETRTANVAAWVETAGPNARIGKTVSRIEITYLKRPGGGSFDVLVDGERKATVATDAHGDGGDGRDGGEAIEAAFFRVDVPDAPHRLECVTRDKKPVRLLGATFERGGPPSIVVDALGVGGASWRTMLRADPATTKATLKRRAYDLVIVQMGTNTWMGELRRAATMREVLDRFRDAIPETPILVMDPPDHMEDGKLIERFVVPEQRRVAAEKRVAFFDFHAAMGGRGSIQRFWMHKMSQGDIIHFNEAGGAYMARRVMHALSSGFAAWAFEHPASGCDSALFSRP